MKASFFAVNLLYLVIVFLIVLESLRFSGQGGLVPLVIGIPTLALLLISLGARCWPALFARMSPAEKDPRGVSLDVAPWSKATPIIGWTGGFFLLIFLIGFKLSILPYVFSFLRFHGKVSWAKSLVTAGVLWILIFVSFDLLLSQPLFEGILFGAVLPLI